MLSSSPTSRCVRWRDIMITNIVTYSSVCQQDDMIIISSTQYDNELGGVMSWLPDRQHHGMVITSSASRHDCHVTNIVTWPSPRQYHVIDVDTKRDPLTTQESTSWVNLHWASLFSPNVTTSIGIMGEITLGFTLNNVFQPTLLIMSRSGSISWGGVLECISTLYISFHICDLLQLPTFRLHFIGIFRLPE